MSKLMIIAILSSQLYLTFAIKYTLTKPNRETVYMDQDVITSEPNAKKLTIQEDFTKISAGLLSITEKTVAFIMDHHSLEKIEPGAFVDQEITKSISLTNNELRIIRGGTFANLKIFELVLSHNRIELIEADAIVNMPNLKIVNLAHNQIIDLDIGWIADTPVMSYIDFAFNQLVTLREDMFNFLTSEKAVSILLDNNEIEVIYPHAFRGLIVGTLNLRENKLESVPDEIFEHDTIRRIFLQYNSLHTLPKSFFNLPHLINAILSGNVFDCETQKELKKLQNKVNNALIVFDESDNC